MCIHILYTRLLFLLHPSRTPLSLYFERIDIMTNEEIKIKELETRIEELNEQLNARSGILERVGKEKESIERYEKSKSVYILEQTEKNKNDMLNNFYIALQDFHSIFLVLRQSATTPEEKQVLREFYKKHEQS